MSRGLCAGCPNGLPFFYCWDGRMDCAAGKPPMHVLNEVTGGALESWKAQQREREELKKNDKTARHL